MRIFIKLISFILSALYFVLAAVGSLLVFPCKVLSLLCCIGGVIALIGEGFNQWQTYMTYFALGAIIYLIPVFITVCVGRFVLWIAETICRI